jgi:hypothetical protein
VDTKINERADNPPERRGLPWAALVTLLILTLVAALVIAYLITRHNFPAR